MSQQATPTSSPLQKKVPDPPALGFLRCCYSGNYQILPVKTWWIREKNNPPGTWKTSVHLHDHGLNSPSNLTIIGSVLGTAMQFDVWGSFGSGRDGSTSHKTLPEFPDLSVLWLLMFVTWPIYLLQKHQAKGNPGNLKSNGKPPQAFCFVLFCVVF